MTILSGRWPVLLFVLLSFNGCASIEGGRNEYVVCPYETVWGAALETLKDRPLEITNKEKGEIQTAWVEMAGTGRTYGVFGREGFGDRQRARITLTLKREQDVTAVAVTEYREQWHRKGGATQQATKWWPVEPSEEAVAGVMNQLNRRLKELGCSPA
jgi:hypothetical protein